MLPDGSSSILATTRAWYTDPTLHTPQIPDFVPWTAAHFQSEDARDRFLSAVAIQQTSEIEVEPMPGNRRGARVRWRPGRFLGLNDVAYSHGGRIIFPFPKTRRSRSGFNV